MLSSNPPIALCQYIVHIRTPCEVSFVQTDKFLQVLCHLYLYILMKAQQLFFQHITEQWTHLWCHSVHDLLHLRLQSVIRHQVLNRKKHIQ